MKTKMKENYVAPQLIVEKLDAEKLICTSDLLMEAVREDYGEPIIGEGFIW